MTTDSQPIATASARKAISPRGATVFKALLKFRTPSGLAHRDGTRVLNGGRRDEQGTVYADKAEAVAAAERHIVAERERVQAQARSLPPHLREKQMRSGFLQGCFTMWGGKGDVFAVTD